MIAFLASLKPKLIAYGLIALAVVVALFSAQRAGRMAERADTMKRNAEVDREVRAIQKRQAKAAANRPRTRDDLSDRMRGGDF